MQKVSFTTQILLTIAGLWLSQSCYSQDSLQTDRPDQTEGTFIVPENFLQIESGFNWDKVEGRQNALLLPTNLLKFGISDFFEVQACVDFFLDEENNFGMLPISLGVKTQLLKERKYIPEIALIARVQTNNWSSKRFANKNWLPMFRLAFNNTVNDRFSVGYNLGMQWNDGDSDESIFPTYVITLCPGFNINNKLSAYIEGYTNLTKNHADYIVDAGCTYQVHNNCIIDFSVGKYLGTTDRDFYCQIGFTTRINCKR
jgi:hypothetical protein